MIKLTKILFSILLISSFALSSCKKKCDLGESSDTGAIIPNMVIYPQSGYMTEHLQPNQYLVTADSEIADRFLMSTDNGYTRTDFDFGTYSLLAFPITTNCFAVFDRKVEIDHLNQVIFYKIAVRDCGKCSDKRYLENWVAIPAVASNYTVLYDVTQETVY